MMEAGSRRIAPDALAALLAAEIARWGVPGVVAGVTAGGESVVRGAGVTSLADPQPVTEETRFRVASITKPFTATVAALLGAEGLLALDAPVHRAVPALRLADPLAQETVTPRQLLAHLSGLECEPPHHLIVPGADPAALSRAIAALPGVGQLTRPGELWSYCNTGYWLAGHAAAQAAGAPFEEDVRALLLEPLGLTGSGFVHDGTPPAGAALGHAPRRPGDLTHDVLAGYRFPRSRVPSGGLVSTAPDLLRFAGLHLGDALLDLQQPVADGVGVRWGTGWSVDDATGARVVAHAGSYGGFQAQLTLVPAHGIAVVVLTNSGRGSAVARAVVEWALAEAAGLRAPAPAALPAPFNDRRGLAGRYTAQHLEAVVTAQADGTIEIAQRSELATGSFAAPPPLRGIEVAPGLFVVPDGEARGARFDFPAPGRLRVSGRLALRQA